MAENHTLWGRTYLCSPYNGVPPGGAHIDLTAGAKTNNIIKQTAGINILKTFIFRLNMFITAVCFIFLIKLRWPKTKSLNNITPKTERGRGDPNGTAGKPQS